MSSASERPGDDGVCVHEGEECGDPERCPCFCEDCQAAYDAENAEEPE